MQEHRTDAGRQTASVRYLNGNDSMAADHFENCTDEELISLSRGGNSAATDFLMERYKGMVRSRARSLHIAGGDQDDLIQEGMLGLFRALRDYDAAKGASFATFASLCISRQMYTAIEASGRQKHQPLNEAISYDQTSGTGGQNSRNDQNGQRAGWRNREDGGESVLAMLPASEGDPEEQYISEESRQRLEQEIDRSLSPYERQVLNLYLSGMNYTEIAQRLGRDPRSTDNALQRIKSKVRRML